MYPSLATFYRKKLRFGVRYVRPRVYQLGTGGKIDPRRGWRGPRIACVCLWTAGRVKDPAVPKRTEDSQEEGKQDTSPALKRWDLLRRARGASGRARRVVADPG